jgi:NifU-like protein involved in Fe-S cluster formation
MTPGHIQENERLTARERWLRDHKEVRFYLRHDEYELLEGQASQEGLTVKDYILKIARELEQLKAEIPTLRKLGVECKPSNIIECVNSLKEKLLIQMLLFAACKEYLERLKKQP